MHNRGQLIEDEMILHLNDKKIRHLSDNLRYMLEDLFGVLDRNEIVKCVKADDWIKPDILITYQGKTKGLSIKSGRADIFHQEQLKYFIPYIREQGISEPTINALLIFLYGDGTIDGSGKERVNQNMIYEQYKDEIAKANEELNENFDFVSLMVDRFLFYGVNPDAYKADAIYIGDAYEGITVTRKQMMKFIRNTPYSFYKNPHIGPLLLVPGARYIGMPIKSEDKRNRVQAWWPNAGNTFAGIAKRYSSYTPLHHRTFEE